VAWIQIIATATTISSSLQPLDRSLTGFASPWGAISFSFGKSLGNLVRNISRVQVRKNEDIGFDEVLQFSTIFLYFQ